MLYHDSIQLFSHHRPAVRQVSNEERGRRRDENQEEHAGDAVDGASTRLQSNLNQPVSARRPRCCHRGRLHALSAASSVEQVENELPRRRGSGRMDRRPSAAAAAGQLAEDSSADTLDLK